MSKTCQKVLQDLYDSVKTQGEQIAIVDYSGKRKTTWKEFIIYINSAAYYLKKEGIKKGDIIALELGRTMEHFAMRLACHYIGAIWFSVNKDYPEDRKLEMYKFCKPKLIVQEKNLNEIEVDEYPCQINYEIEDHEPGIIVFTSGTTGIPKGVLHDRTLYFASIIWKEAFGFNLSGDYAIVADLMFAASLGDMYFMCQKFTCHIVDNEIRKDPIKLKKHFIDNSIEYTLMIPSLLRLILPIPSLKKVLILGEKNVYNFSDVSTVVINLYASSEAFPFVFGIVGIDKGFGRTVPYCKICLLDENGKEISKNDTTRSGEICCIGFTIAIKYLDGEPNKTTEVILENGETMVLRTFKMGDIGRYNSDGTIEVLGRKDSMVKIRGNRVDVVEVEYNILKQENIFEAAVKCFNKGNENYLCAYYTTYDKNEINEEIIRENLKKVVPEYMIPAFFVYKEKFEKNVHGKIDREKLLEPKTENKKNIFLKDEIEKELIEIIKNVVKIKKVGTEDSLKNMGISSLSAIQIQLEIENSFGVNIIASKLMNLDIIKEIANEIKKQKKEKIIKEVNIKEELINDKEQSIRKYYPIKNMVRGMYECCMDMQKFNDTFEEKLTTYHQAFVVEIQNTNLAKIEELVKKLLDIHPILKASIEIYNGVPCFVKRNDWYPSFNETILDKQPDYNYFKTCYKHFQMPGNDLFRVKVLRYEKIYYVFIDINHLLVDGYSMTLIIRNIKRILNNKTVLNEYINFFDLQEQYEQKIEIKDNYFEHLLGNNELLMLSCDEKPDGNLPIYANIQIPTYIPNITKQCKKYKFKESTIFLTACIKALSEFLNQKQVCLATINFNRDEKTLRTVGCLYEMVPVVYNKNLYINFEEEVKELEEQLIENVKHNYNYNNENSIKGHTFYNYIADLGAKIPGEKINISKSASILFIPYPDYGYANMPLSFEIIKINEKEFIINIDYDASKYNKNNILTIGNEIKKILMEKL